jgi:hypothetical protein
MRTFHGPSDWGLGSRNEGEVLSHHLQNHIIWCFMAFMWIYPSAMSGRLADPNRITSAINNTNSSKGLNQVLARYLSCL